MNGKLISKKESELDEINTAGRNGGSLNTPLASYIERRKLRGTKQSKCAAAFFAVTEMWRKL